MRTLYSKYTLTEWAPDLNTGLPALYVIEVHRENLWHRLINRAASALAARNPTRSYVTDSAAPALKE